MNARTRGGGAQSSLVADPVRFIAEQNGTMVEQSISLTCSSSHWTKGKPGVPKFTASSKAGGPEVTIVSQSVLSPTSATIVVKLSTTGQFTITDTISGGSVDLVGTAVFGNSVLVGALFKPTSPTSDEIQVMQDIAKWAIELADSLKSYETGDLVNDGPMIAMHIEKLRHPGMQELTSPHRYSRAAEWPVPARGHLVKLLRGIDALVEACGWQSIAQHEQPTGTRHCFDPKSLDRIREAASAFLIKTPAKAPDPPTEGAGKAPKGKGANTAKEGRRPLTKEQVNFYHEVLAEWNDARAEKVSKPRFVDDWNERRENRPEARQIAESDINKMQTYLRSRIK